MPIPDYSSMMLPLLRFIQDGKEYASQELLHYFENEFHVDEEEKKLLVPSRNQSLFSNRLDWAKAYLKWLG
jgi:restriction system protein